MSDSLVSPDRTLPKVARSLIIPVYRNAENIEDLIVALIELSKKLEPGFEIVFVVDGSPDNSGDLLLKSRKRLPCRSKVAFHSRNFGSFAAIRTGLELAAGDHAAAMAADLQEPPELVLSFFDILAQNEADVVFGERIARGDPPIERLTSSFFWWVYRKFVFAEMPKGGIDLFACNRAVRDAVLSIAEPNSSLIAQLFWVGFRRAYVPYVRRARRIGKSGWSFARRLRYMMDSILSFSDAPIIFVLWSGVIGCIASIILSIVTLVARLSGLIAEPGYTTLLIAVLFFGSAILAVQGIIGSYLWRTFENTKKRPLTIISMVVSD